MKNQIAALIAKALLDLGIPDVAVEVTTAEDASHGDYTTNIAMKIWRSPQSPLPREASAKWGQSPQFSSPMEIALQVKEAISYQLSAISQKTGDQNIVKHGQKKSSKVSHQDILSAIDRVEVAPPGFINVFLSKASLITSLGRLLKLTQSDTSVQTHHPSRIPHHPMKIMVEFAHPNTHKAFHIGHLRNITTGESIIRLLESQGNTIIRANYQGDVGMHIAKALYALLKLSAFSHQLSAIRKKDVKEKVEFLGKAYAAGSKAFEEDEEAKEEIVSLNALVYAAAQQLARERGIDPGTTDYMALVKDTYKPMFEQVYTLWKETRQWSLDYFETIYKRVGSRYDRYYFESECLAGVDLARNAVKKGVLKEDAGAVILDGKPYGIDTRVFINSKGLPTYEGKELKLSTMESTEHGKIDRIIHVVGPEQTSFFQVTFKAEELLEIVKPGVQHHLIYGWVKLKHGKMSSRSGNVVLGEWLLDEAKKAIYTILERNKSKDKSLDTSDSKDALDPLQRELIAEKAAVAAVKYAFLKVGTTSEIAFDIKESVNFQGDSGPYLQYTYARCKSVLRKAQIGRIGSIGRIGRISLNREERSVLRLIQYFPDVVAGSADHLSPSTLCTYLFKLAQAYNLFYAKHSILGEAEKPSAISHQPSAKAESGKLTAASSFRLSLTSATAQVLKNGLYLLGIETLEKM